MSYMSVQHVVDELLRSQRLFHRWAKKQQAASSDAGCQALLEKIADDASTREAALEDALSQAPRDALTTQLQYESVGDVQTAVEHLPEQLPDEPSVIMEHVSNYYTAVAETFRQAARETSVPAAEDVMGRLADETEAVIANEAWTAREE